ncbi:MAG: GWxTD domain-containing protein [bacterium]
MKNLHLNSKFIFLLISVLTLAAFYNSCLFSQTNILYKVEQPPDVPVFDVVLFNFASENFEKSRLMFNIKFVNDELQFIKTKEGKFRADYEVSIVIFDGAGSRVDSLTWKEYVIAQNFDETNSINLFNFTEASFDLLANEYQFRIGLKDLETRRTGYQQGSVTLRDYSMDEVLVSDILFLDYLSVGEEGEINISPKIAGNRHEKSILYAYFEVYNVTESDSINVMYQIFGPGNKIIQKGEYWIISRGRITPNYIEIAKDKLSYTDYRTEIMITNNGNTVKVEKPFKLYSQSLSLSFSDIDDAIEKLKYIATDKELKKIKNAKEEDKRKEFNKFWELHDPTPGTHENELMEDYYRRIEFANEKFPGNRDGWKTDMGLVYIKLGPPDYIENPELINNLHFIDETSRRRYRIVWQYYDIGRNFIFYYQAGEFRLANLQEVYDVLY